MSQKTATVAVCPNHLMDDGTISQWKKDHEGYEIYSDMDSAIDSLLVDKGFFDSDKDIYLVVDEVKANEMRDLASSAKDVSVMVVTAKKPRSSFSKDSIKVVDLSKFDGAAIKRISQRTKVPEHIIRSIYKQNDNVISTLSMVNQLSHIDDLKNYKPSDLYDLFPGDNPPWDITNSVISGNVTGASTALDSHLSKYKKKADIVSLSFQLAGYFRKVIVAGDDSGSFIKGNSPFPGYYKRIKNVAGLIEDLSYYPGMVFKVKNPDIIIKSMVVSMASRF